MIPERVDRLIMRSKLPAAEQFEEWMVGTVLPTLRKDGVYVQGEEKLNSPDQNMDDLDALNDHTVALLKRKEATIRKPEHHTYCSRHILLSPIRDVSCMAAR